MKTQIVVMAHGAEQNTFDRHKRFWNQAPVAVVTNDADPVKTEWPIILRGEPCKGSGLPYYRRVMQMLERLSALDADQFVIHEYDSICLSDDLPVLGAAPALYGNCFINEDGDPNRFKAHRYATTPYMFSRATLDILRRTALANPSVTEEGFIDRMLSAFTVIAGIPVLDYTPPGFSRNTILEDHRRAMCDAILAGGTMIHGLKDTGILVIATKTFEQAKKNHLQS